MIGGAMKTFLIMILMLLLIASVSLNVWFYTFTSNLNDEIDRQLGYGDCSEYKLPHETMSQLRLNFSKLISQNQKLQLENHKLKLENQQYKAALSQIREEAERAQRLGIFSSLLRLIFSLF